MDKKLNNEELQSRREFFKKAAKGALPILAAVAIASAPTLVKAAEDSPMGCTYGTCNIGCTSSCSGGCSGNCYRGCSSGCDTSCRGTCEGTCARTCSGTCSGGCSGGSTARVW